MRAAIILVSGVLLATPALAQDQEGGDQATPATSASSGGRAFEDGALDLDASSAGTVIVGKEHLPDFTVLIDREDLSKAYDLELDERFLPKIIEAVGKAPF